MHWIALQPSLDDERGAWGWRALQFTPRVAQVDEALLLEVSTSERLFGGRDRLLRLVFESGLSLARAEWSQGATSLIALALLRLQLHGRDMPAASPDGLSLRVLSAALPHVETLARMGCRSWGELRALPRAGVARRFGAALLDALDAAYGERSELYPWLTLPEVFDVNLELPALATSAPELMWSAQRLLTQLQVWLQARHRGVLALELEWKLDLRRLNGVRLPGHEQLVVRTAQPTQDVVHLRRLVGEHLSRAALSAPASHLRLRSLETLPWAGASRSFLPEDNVKGEKLHQLVERLGARLGAHNVVMQVAQADHRPEFMQRWVPAQEQLPQVQVPDMVEGLQAAAAAAPAAAQARKKKTPAFVNADALYPTWLLSQPLRLEVHRHVPHYMGPLRRLARARRVEAGWWAEAGPALRDYFIARSEGAGLVWIYRERPLSTAETTRRTQEHRWYLHGLYA